MADRKLSALPASGALARTDTIYIARPGVGPRKATLADVAVFTTPVANVKDAGALGDANDDASVGTDDTAAIQAALDQLAVDGGGTLFFPHGNYKISSYLTVPNNVMLKGTGRKGSKIVGTHAGGGGATAAQSVRNGSILYNAQPINTSTRADITIEDLWLSSANDVNQGAGFYQQSGVVVTLRNCQIEGSKWGVILDQSEEVLIDGCEMGSNIAGGAGLWIVNGADLDPTAEGSFTNIITVRGGSLNVGAACRGVIDDGGYEHLYQACNFNGGINGLRAAGVQGLFLGANYFESQSDHSIVLDNLSAAGNGVGGGLTTVVAGYVTAAGGKHAIMAQNAPGQLTVVGGAWTGGAGTSPLGGTANLFSVSVINPGLVGYPITPFCDGKASGVHFEPASGLLSAYFDIAKVGVGTGAASTSSIYFERAGAGGASYLSVWNNGVRQGYGFFLGGAELQFAAEGTATSFRFLSPVSVTGAIAGSAGITSSGGGVGYATGAGGTIAQATSKATAVQLDKLCGNITLNAAALAAGATASFVLTNNKVAAGDLLILNHISGGTIGAYNLNAHGAAAGSITIDVTNRSAGSLSEAPVIRFAIIKGVTA